MGLISVTAYFRRPKCFDNRILGRPTRLPQVMKSISSDRRLHHHHAVGLLAMASYCTTYTVGPMQLVFKVGSQ